MTPGQMAGRWMYLERSLKQLYAGERTPNVERQIEKYEQEKAELAEKLRRV